MVQRIASTLDGNCALIGTDSVSCWSDGMPPTTVFQASEISTPGPHHVFQIAGGDHHYCILVDDGAVRCWGDNTFGQLGDGTRTASAVPVPVLGTWNSYALAAGGDHSCVANRDGTLKCWGRNDFGQLGDGTQEDRSLPIILQLQQ
jgi:alpha-tubulin suppressor-like RCC1 family protein